MILCFGGQNASMSCLKLWPSVTLVPLDMTKEIDLVNIMHQN
jgi:hypothetical protein